MALQEAAKVYLVLLLKDTNLPIIHAKRVTVTSPFFSYSSHDDCWLFPQPVSQPAEGP